MYRNGEGYSDPTAGAAIGSAMKEYRQERRKQWQRETEIKERPKVYVVSRYAGDVSKNVEAARKYCRIVTDAKRIPLASHLLYPQFLNDNDPAERQLGTMFGLALLAICDEVWCFGTEHSAGMQGELYEAKRLKKPIRYFDLNGKEVEAWQYRRNSEN